MLHTHVADLNWLSNCWSLNWSIRKLDLYSCILAVKQTNYRRHVVFQQSVHVVHFIHSVVDVDIHRMFHAYSADITWLFNSPIVDHFIHSCIMAVFFTLLLQAPSDYPTVHPQVVLFMRHSFIYWYSIGFSQFCNFLPCNFSCPNKTQLIECLAGSYAATGSIKCQPCPKGAFCPTKVQPTFHLCPNGTYSDVEGLSDCKICDAGFKCPSIGMEEPEECPNGTYSYSAGARYCVLCPEGHRWG